MLRRIAPRDIPRLTPPAIMPVLLPIMGPPIFVRATFTTVPGSRGVVHEDPEPSQEGRCPALSALTAPTDRPVRPTIARIPLAIAVAMKVFFRMMYSFNAWSLPFPSPFLGSFLSPSPLPLAYPYLRQMPCPSPFPHPGCGSRSPSCRCDCS